jgi:hypothetical protein
MSVVALLHGVGARATATQLEATWSNTIVDANPASPLNFEAVATHPDAPHIERTPYVPVNGVELGSATPSNLVARPMSAR